MQRGRRGTSRRNRGASGSAPNSLPRQFAHPYFTRSRVRMLAAEGRGPPILNWDFRAVPTLPSSSLSASSSRHIPLQRAARALYTPTDNLNANNDNQDDPASGLLTNLTNNVTAHVEYRPNELVIQTRSDRDMPRLNYRNWNPRFMPNDNQSISSRSSASIEGRSLIDHLTAVVTDFLNNNAEANINVNGNVQNNIYQLLENLHEDDAAQLNQIIMNELVLEEDEIAVGRHFPFQVFIRFGPPAFESGDPSIRSMPFEAFGLARRHCIFAGTMILQEVPRRLFRADNGDGEHNHKEYSITVTSLIMNKDALEAQSRPNSEENIPQRNVYGNQADPAADASAQQQQQQQQEQQNNVLNANENAAGAMDNKNNGNEAPIEQNKVNDTAMEQNNLNVTTVEQNYVNDAPMEHNYVNNTAVEQNNVNDTPMEQNDVNVNATPMEQNDVNDAPMEQNDVNVNDTPMEQNDVNDTAVEQNDVNDAPMEQNDVNDTPMEQNDVNDTAVEQNDINDAPMEENYVNNTLMEQNNLNDTPMEQNNEDDAVIVVEANNANVAPGEGNGDVNLADIIMVESDDSIAPIEVPRNNVNIAPVNVIDNPVVRNVEFVNIIQLEDFLDTSIVINGLRFLF